MSTPQDTLAHPAAADTEPRLIDVPTDWKEHEFQAPAVQVAAIRLLREAGTMEFAVHALETADRLLKDAEAYEMAFAKGCGHASFTELVAASRTVSSDVDSPWYLTQLRNGSWLAWNKNSLENTREFASPEAAERFVELQGE
jgi:hypothetical protein